MCLREVGLQLQQFAESLKIEALEAIAVENVVTTFARNVRLIAQNCMAYANAGPTVISAGAELLRIFERLFFDWVLAPEAMLPPLDGLDDDRCVDHHPSDAESTVLLCDGCEGKYNITRLEPPLREIPKGDWYCPRCVTGRWWGHLDPRVGKEVRMVVDVPESSYQELGPEGVIDRCVLRYTEGMLSAPSLLYVVKYMNGAEENWTLEQVDRALERKGNKMSPIRCREAVSESPGYGFGVDHGLRTDLVPATANPNISDSAAQVSLSSSVFRDTITASATLLVIDPRAMTAHEWHRLLVLLVMKCSSSDVIQNVTSVLESTAAEKMAASLEKIGHVSNIQEILPEVCEDSADDASGLSRHQDLSESNDPPEAPLSSHVRVETLPAILETPSKPISDLVVEASAVEVVEEMDVDDGEPLLALSGDASEQPPIEIEPPFAAALAEKRKRLKMMEDSFAAYCIKNQIRPTVASFEEDTVSHVVDLCLSAKTPALDFSSLRCRRALCAFCGLTDIALGLPLVRVPDEDEWEEIVAHAARSHRITLVAAIIEHSETESTMHKGHIAVKLRVGGELFSVKETGLAEFTDGGMLEFAPRSEVSFQDELQFRYDSGLPFISGSLSAHECCAVAAHNARKDQMVQRYKEREAVVIEREAGMSCGRTLELTRDADGRSYWKFYSDPEALFVCMENPTSNEGNNSIPRQWHRYSGPERIASLLVSLGRDSAVRDLHRAFPRASAMVRDRSWIDGLLKQQFPTVAALISGNAYLLEGEAERVDIRANEVDVGFEPYKIGEKVLVKSLSGGVLWDAVVKAQSKTDIDRESGHEPSIDAYQVAYSEWANRFNEWVEPDRVVQHNEKSLLQQSNLLDERSSASYGLPACLSQLLCKDFLHARDRARGKSPLPDFSILSHVDNSQSSNASTFAAMKAGLLAIEAALPLGCVDSTEKGAWRPEIAQRWRSLVVKSEGPCTLTRCAILLEETISPEWIKEDVGHLRSCLPAKWKAVGEASPAALAMRIILLDRSIMYGTVDRKRFASKRKVTK